MIRVHCPFDSSFKVNAYKGVQEIKDMLCCREIIASVIEMINIDDAVCLSKVDGDNDAKTRGALHSLCLGDTYICQFLMSTVSPKTFSIVQ